MLSGDARAGTPGRRPWRVARRAADAQCARQLRRKRSAKSIEQRLPAPKVRNLFGDEILEGNAHYLRDRQDCAQRWICRASRPRLTLLILLIRVTRQTCAVRQLFLTEASALTSAAKCCRQPLSVDRPLLLSGDVDSVGHLLRFSRRARPYGLIGMAQFGRPYETISSSSDLSALCTCAAHPDEGGRVSGRTRAGDHDCDG